MIRRATACAVLVAAGVAVAAPTPKTVTVAPEAVPAAVAAVLAAVKPAPGWTVDGAALRGPGTELRVAALTGWCGQWAGSLRTPDWAPTSAWPSARVSPGGVALCVQRRDDALLVTLGGLPEQAAPDADTLAMLLAVADAIRPPLAIPNPGGAALSVRLPVPATAIAGTSKFAGFDGVEQFELSAWVQEGACFIGGQLVADDETPAPWLRAHEDLEDRQLLCAELRDRAVGLKWPLSELPLRGAMLVALGAPAVAAYGPALTNDGGSLPLGGASMHLDPTTAGRWKVVVTGDVTELSSLDPGVPFVIDVIPQETCPAGDRIAEERSQGFAPPGLVPVRIAKPASPTTTLRLAMCLHVGTRTPVIEVHSLARAAEPPSGPAAVKIRAALVAVASTFHVDPEGNPRAPERGAPGHERAPIAAHYRTDVALWGGLLSLSPADRGVDRGVLVGADVRASPKYGLGLAANLAGAAGYTSGIEEQLRGSLGVGFGIGFLSLQATAGASVGSLGNGGTLGVYGQASALLDVRVAVLTAAVLHSLASYGDDETRYDFRIAVAPDAARSTFSAGLSLIEYGENGGSAFLAYLGFGFTSGHEPAAAP